MNKKLIIIILIFFILYIFINKSNKNIKNNENFENKNILPYALFINLKHRKDRLKNVKKQMKNWPEDKLIRINAIKNKDGALGCGLSHIKALKKAKILAKEHNLNHILILEDDFKWKHKMETTIKIFREAFNSKIEWDVITLITATAVGAKVEKTKNILRRIKKTGSTAGYIIKTSYIDKLLNLWTEAMEARKTKYNKKKWNAHSSNIDQAWKQLQEIDNWFTTKPTLIRIIDSTSDITSSSDPALNWYD